MFKNILVLFCVFPFMVQCASFGGTFDKEKVKKIKKIAIVGFSYDGMLETSENIQGAIMGKEKSAGPGMMGSMKNEFTEPETPISRMAYDQILMGFKKVGWQTRSGTEVQASSAVKAFYNRSVKVGYWPLDQGSSRYEREKIPQYVHVASLSGKGEFSKMAKDLGVDAIAVVYVKSVASQTIPLVTKMSHSAQIIMQIYDPLTDAMVMNFSSNGQEIDGTTKTKMGDDFLADMKKGVDASTKKFAEDLQNKLK